jgi:hypothetical protein
MIDRIPMLSDLPLVGRRFFQKTQYQIDSAISPESLTEARQWITKSANQGFYPAKQALKLLGGALNEPPQ